MSAWIRSPRGSVATAIATAVVLVGLWLIPIVRQHGPLTFWPVSVMPWAVHFGFPSVPAPTGQSTPKAEDKPAEARQPTADRAVLDSRRPDQGGETVPSFDIVRVDPHGDTVVAGRSAPGAEIALVDGGKILARVTASEAGQFVILPPTLAPGDHYLTLQVIRDGKPAASGQGVAVSVAPDAAKPLVALLTPGQPVNVLSGGAESGASKAPSAGIGSASSSVAIQSVETGGLGTFTASGIAKAGSQCRIYLNGAFLADVTVGTDGRWSVKVEDGMKAGKYVVRADQLENDDGTVVDRAEVSFDFPESATTGHGRQVLMAKASGLSSPAGSSGSDAGRMATVDPLAATGSDGASAGTTTVKDLQSATVVHGDSLWRISRKLLGNGFSYTEIYASNTKQIRNPRLIYPGQVFVLPHHLAQDGKAAP